ncbi:MAG: metal ABC transporter solute-binding protein, Zn/Mn family [Acetobacteraceae bacterium]
MHRRSLLALPALLLPGTLRAQTAALPVVASFTILADMAREIGGERVAVRAIAGPDADAHHFQPRPSDAAALRGAAVLIRNGLGFDGWADRMARAANWRGRTVTATEGITPRMVVGGHAHGHSHGRPGQPSPDPHAWQDLSLGRRYAAAIAAGLSAADGDGAAYYAARAAAYDARLAALDAEVRAAIGTVPEARRVVVTSHDAFGYFGAAYGVRFLAPAGVSTTAEPSAQQVARLIRLIREQDVTALFMENMANPANLRRIAAETGVAIGGRLYADSLSPPDGPAPTYEAMFRHNVGLLVPAMRGRAA